MTEGAEPFCESTSYNGLSGPRLTRLSRRWILLQYAATRNYIFTRCVVGCMQKILPQSNHTDSTWCPKLL